MHQNRYVVFLKGLSFIGELYDGIVWMKCPNGWLEIGLLKWCLKCFLRERPYAFLPSPKPTFRVACSPIIFELRQDVEGNASGWVHSIVLVPYPFPFFFISYTLLSKKYRHFRFIGCWFFFFFLLSQEKGLEEASCRQRGNFAAKVSGFNWFALCLGLWFQAAISDDLGSANKGLGYRLRQSMYNAFCIRRQYSLQHAHRSRLEHRRQNPPNFISWRLLQFYQVSFWVLLLLHLCRTVYVSATIWVF